MIELMLDTLGFFCFVAEVMVLCGVLAALGLVLVGALLGGRDDIAVLGLVFWMLGSEEKMNKIQLRLNSRTTTVYDFLTMLESDEPVWLDCKEGGGFDRIEALRARFPGEIYREVEVSEAALDDDIAKAKERRSLDDDIAKAKERRSLDDDIADCAAEEGGY